MASTKYTFSNRLTTSNTPADTNYTLQEIADMMNVTKERVRQIEAKALNKLRKRLHGLDHTQNNLLNN